MRDTTAPNFNPRTWTIRLWEAIAAAVMLCREPLHNKLLFMFELADTSYKKQLGYVDFAALLTSVVRAGSTPR